jgi:hypothetical protein
VSITSLSPYDSADESATPHRPCCPATDFTRTFQYISHLFEYYTSFLYIFLHTHTFPTINQRSTTLTNRSLLPLPTSSLTYSNVRLELNPVHMPRTVQLRTRCLVHPLHDNRPRQRPRPLRKRPIRQHRDTAVSLPQPPGPNGRPPSQQRRHQPASERYVAAASRSSCMAEGPSAVREGSLDAPRLETGDPIPVAVVP